MRTMVKRCEVWWSTRWESLDEETRKLFTLFNTPVESEYGVNAKCPFCGGRFFAEESTVPQAFPCPCGAELHVKPMCAVRKTKRLRRPTRKVKLLCWECGWEGEWGRAECVRRIQEDYGELLCPECCDDLGVEYEEGVPRYVKNASFR